MAKFLARHIAPEMLGLLLLEAGLAFGIAYAVGAFTLGRPEIDAFDAHVANQALIAAVTVALTSVLLGLYRPSLFLRTRSLLLSTALGGAIAFGAVWAVLSALGMRSEWVTSPDRSWPVELLALWIVGLFAVRICMHLMVRSGLFARRVSVAGPPGELARSVAAIHGGPAGYFKVVRTDGNELSPAEMRARGLRIALMSQRQFDALPAETVAAFAHAGIDLEPEPLFWERHLRRVDIESVTPAWVADLDARKPNAAERLVVRAGDIVTSLALLLFTLPLMLLAALLVRLESKGPVLYRQERVGLGGRPFVLLKFRSMNHNAEARGPAWAQQRDPRVTRVGGVMRRLRIDELPQLINVLQGEMSFIGPRPERPHFVEQLAAVIPYYAERSRVKPGLTGWAQVNYPYGASVEDAQAKLSYDLYYVRHRSMLLDLGIMISTVRVILFQEGAR